jgi:hypothetical protein
VAVGRPISLIAVRHVATGLHCRNHGTILAEHRTTCQAGNTVESVIPRDAEALEL